MKVLEIKSGLFNNYYLLNNLAIQNNNYNIKMDSPIERDIFQKSPAVNVSFVGEVSEVQEQDEFKKKYSGLFKKLLKEGIPCAYTNLPMVPPEELQRLVDTGAFNKDASISMGYLKRYEDSIVPGSIERQAFDLLEKGTRKHPNMTLQEIIRLRYPYVENALVAKQTNIINDIILMARRLPPKDYKAVRALTQVSIDKILAQDPKPEERFSRKKFLYPLHDLSLSDSGVKKAIWHKAIKLPQSSTSLEAFIVKYSQPYKIKRTEEGEEIRVVRDSSDLANRILCRYRGTDDHIYPQVRYKKEADARKRKEKWAQGLSNYKVTILTSDYINNKKGDTLIDDFINRSEYPIPRNIQRQVNRFIEIYKKWIAAGKINDAVLLEEYLRDLKKEFELRSNIVRIDISDLRKVSLSDSSQNSDVPRGKKRNKKPLEARRAHYKNSLNRPSKAYRNGKNRRKK